MASRRPTRTRSTSAFSRRKSSAAGTVTRSEEHTSELQSLRHLVCRLLLEKKKEKNKLIRHNRGPHLAGLPEAGDLRVSVHERAESRRGRACRKQREVRHDRTGIAVRAETQ